jgi:hypothetical protein
MYNDLHFTGMLVSVIFVAGLWCILRMVGAA